jgi:hypothetical protein
MPNFIAIFIFFPLIKHYNERGGEENEKEKNDNRFSFFWVLFTCNFERHPG